jgi:hypothetical protein
MMRSERLLLRLIRFIKAMDATIVRSSSARTLLVSGERVWFFRSSFIGSLFRVSLVPQAHDVSACGTSKALQCGCNVAAPHEGINSNDIASKKADQRTWFITRKRRRNFKSRRLRQLPFDLTSGLG